MANWELKKEKNLKQVMKILKLGLYFMKQDLKKV